MRRSICTGGASVSTRTLVQLWIAELAALARVFPQANAKTEDGRKPAAIIILALHLKGLVIELTGVAMGKLARFAVIAVVVMGISSLQPVSAWGPEGHTWINEVAAEKLPKSMPSFLHKAADRLGYLGPEPDRWRNQNGEPELKYSQEADHFIDLERLPADFGEFPL